MHRLRLPAALALLLLALLAPAFALADDWVVTKLRGKVLQLVEDQWSPLERGDVVPDDRVLRSLQSGRAELRRGEEVIALGPSSQIQIHDRAGQRFTTVQQYFGTVEIDAEALNVQHFAVQTPYLAAVVKGTRFAVVTGKNGSEVSVQRGHVAVSDPRSGLATLLGKGQAASVGVDGGFVVEGKGDLPAVVDKTGMTVVGTVDGGDIVTGKGAVVSRDADGDVVVTLPDVAQGKVGIKDGVNVETKVGGDNGLHLGLDVGGSRGHGHEGNDDDDDEAVSIDLGGDDGLHLGIGHGGSDSGPGLGIGLGGLNL